MAVLTCEIPTSVLDELVRSAGESGSLSYIVTAALSEYLETPVHTLFQVSTSGALVAGVSSSAVTCALLLEHGDFGLGTFERLDGEMVIVDGHVYRAQGDGTVSAVPGDAAAPFAVVTRFAPDVDVDIPAVESLDALYRHCDGHRASDNLFYAVRLDGVFQSVRVRAFSVPAGAHPRLIDAARMQTERELTAIRGTLVGIWSPGFSSAFSVPGYHMHFISDDRQHGGHLLACSAAPLRLRVEALTDFHLALPETESFLKADLRTTAANELAYAEQAH